MNDISNHSPRSLGARVSIVPSKPALAKDKAVNGEEGGKLLPPESKPVAKTDQPSSKAVDTDKMQTANRENVKAAIAKMNEYTQSIQRDLRFNMDEASGRTVVTVMDRESKEVIRQIPDEVFLKLARNIQEQLQDNFGKQALEHDRNALNLIDTRA